MKRYQRLIVVWAALLGFSDAARGQTEVLDLDALGSSFGIGLLAQDRTEFLYSRIVAGSDPNTLHAISLSSPGVTRQIPTTGIDVSQYRLDRFSGRGLVIDSVNKGVFSVDFASNGSPIPLSPEPGTSATLAPAGGLVALPIAGDAASTNPANRDQLYTRSILGGPAVEVTGGIPQQRQISEYMFAEDGGMLMVGTKLVTDNTVPQTTKVFFATPGTTGLTPVLNSLASNTRFIPLGSDASGDHFAFVAHTTINNLWSVSTSNAAAATMLNRDAQGDPIYFDNWMIDSVGNRAFFSSFENDVPAFPYAIWSVPLDGSSPAAILGRLPSSQGSINMQPIVGDSWLYVQTNTVPASLESRAYAIPLAGGQAVEYRDPGHIDVTLFTISPDGSSALFSDGRTAGNDLYLGRPGDTASPMVTLLDVADTDRLVRTAFSLDGKFAIAALVSASLNTTSVADRLLAIPVDGGPPVTIDDGTLGPVTAQFSNTSFSVRSVAGNQLFYLKGYSNGQAGFYVADLPEQSPGDFNGDGAIDAADYVIWRKTGGSQNDYETWRAHFGQANVTSPPGDFNHDGTVDAADYVIWRKNPGGIYTPDDYNTWRSHFGQSSAAGTSAIGSAFNSTVPEPAAALLLVPGAASVCWRRRRHASRVPKLVWSDTR